MLTQEQELILSEYSGLYDIVVPQDNLLRRINALIDFSFVYQEYVMAVKGSEQHPWNIRYDGGHEEVHHVLSDVTGMDIPLDQEEGEDGKCQTACHPHQMIGHGTADGILTAKKIQAQMVNCHGNDGYHFQAASAQATQSKAIRHPLLRLLFFFPKKLIATLRPVSSA